MTTPLPSLSQDDKNNIFDVLDLSLNCMVLEAWLHGLYTGIIAATLWTVSSSSKRSSSTFLRTTIITLYMLSTILFTIDWAFERRAFIEHSNNYYSVFTALVDNHSPLWRADFLWGGITSGISTILVDIIIIWRCWTVWDRQWRVVSLAILCVIVGTAMKTMQIINEFNIPAKDISGAAIFPDIDWPLVYILMMLAPTLMCTILIVYRIICVAQKVFLFRDIIAALIESAGVYTLALIIDLAMTVANINAVNYLVYIVAYIKVIAPTLLMLHVASLRSDSGTDGEESTNSRPLSDINFRPMWDNTSSENSSDQSASQDITEWHARTKVSDSV
ncbi:hypothetical protein IW262DRAFT_1460688 [Armillaria fumosa]|nr:hypothetical protein IW262DRAFT_1460688 [Armillaria fumosa]